MEKMHKVISPIVCFFVVVFWAYNIYGGGIEPGAGGIIPNPDESDCDCLQYLEVDPPNDKKVGSADNSLSARRRHKG